MASRPRDTDYIDRRIASAPYKMEIPMDDGEVLIVFSFRPLNEAMADMLSDAIECNKPVPSVLGSNHPANRRLPSVAGSHISHNPT